MYQQQQGGLLLKSSMAWTQKDKAIKKFKDVLNPQETLLGAEEGTQFNFSIQFKEIYNISWNSWLAGMACS